MGADSGGITGEDSGEVGEGVSTPSLGGGVGGAVTGSGGTTGASVGDTVGSSVGTIGQNWDPGVPRSVYGVKESW